MVVITTAREAKVATMRNGLSSAARWSLLGWTLSQCTFPAASRVSTERDAEAAVLDGAAEPDSSASVGELTRDGAADGELRDASMRPDAGTLAQACAAQEPRECPTPPTRYAEVQPIFERRCVLCHAPRSSGPWPLDGYQEVADWQDDVRADLLDCSMPPADAGVAITPEERQQLLSFLRCGLPM
ncbi:MAG: hypothetical protein JWN04_2244 [Myxococcaceae bacterium]|nr:hypothetical protein [Myxococcaceae bacterium]